MFIRAKQFFVSLHLRFLAGLLSLCLTMLSLAACDPGGCTLNIVPGVVVDVKDRLTDEYLTTKARGVVREGTFQDSLREGEQTLDFPPRTISLFGAEERPAMDPAP